MKLDNATAERRMKFGIVVCLLLIMHFFIGESGAEFPQYSDPIVFVSDRVGNSEIYTMQVDGGQLQRLTYSEFVDEEPAWSPDGSQIAFHSNRDGDFEIYVMNADGTDLRQLTDNTHNDGAPSWSPDGSKILFHSDGDLRPEQIGGRSEIFMMNADGSERKQLTDNTLTKFMAQWHPDGKRIGFYGYLSRRSETLSTINNHNAVDLYVYELSGKSLRNVSRDSPYAGEMAWSPDGLRIAHSMSSIYDEAGRDLYIIDADGTNRQQLTHASGYDGYPRWSPDGRQIIFHSSRSGNLEIYTIDLETRRIDQITHNTHQDKFPSWPLRRRQPFSASLDSVNIAYIEPDTARVLPQSVGILTPVETGSGAKAGTKRVYGRGDGLPPELSVTTAIQDRHGRMWFGTRNNGVIRYDGDVFSQLQLDSRWARNWVYALAEDRGNALWIGTDRGVAVLEGDQLAYLTEENALPALRTYSLLPGLNGDMWVGTEKGLYRVRAESGSWIAALLPDFSELSIYALCRDAAQNIWVSSNRGVYYFDGQKSQYVAIPNARDQDMSIYTAQSREGPSHIFNDSKNHLWFAFGGYVLPGGITHYDGRDFTVYGIEQSLPNLMVGRVVESSRGTLWMRFGGRGLVRFSETFADSLPLQENFSRGASNALVIDVEDNIWTGSRDGIFCYIQDQIDVFRVENGLGSIDVRALLEDGKGQLWTGSHGGGVSRFDGQRFETFTTADGLMHNTVGEIVEDRRGHLWFAVGGIESVRTGVSRFDGQRFETFTTADGLVHDEVWTICEDSRGILWFGTRSGVSRYDGERFTSFTHIDGLARYDVWHIAEDRDGHMWFATWGGGVSRYDGQTFTTFTTEDGLPHNDVSYMLEDRDGHMWFATWGGGVSRYDGTKFLTYSTQDGLANDEVGRIFADHRGHLWFTSGGNEVHQAGESLGLTRYNGEEFEIFTRADGLPNVEVWNIAEDLQGHLVLPTLGSGLALYDGAVFQTINAKDGLAGDLVWDALVSRSGDIWLASKSGLTRYRPRVSPPPIEIRQVSTDRQHGTVKSVAFDTMQDYLGIEYHGISYKTRPESILYRHRLRGYDDEWQTTRQKKVEYIDLPLGEYEFEVVAIDRDLNYSAHPAQLKVRVGPPYALIVPGAISALLLVVAIAATARTVQSRSAELRTQRELLHMTSERNAALEQVNAQLREADRLKSDFVSNVSHELRTPLTVIRGSVDNMLDGITGGFNERQGLYLNRLKVHADRLALLIDDLLDLSRIEAGHLEVEKVRASVADIARDVVDHLQPLAEQEKLEVELRTVEGDTEALIDPNRVYQVLLNLVNNAIKFTPPGGRVAVSVKYIAEEVEVAVEDTGPGIVADELGKIFEKFHQIGQSNESYRGAGIGLSIARRLVEMHGGQIRAESEPGVGSRFIFVIPKSI